MVKEPAVLPEAEDLVEGKELTEVQRKSIEDFKNEDWDAKPEDSDKDDVTGKDDTSDKKPDKEPDKKEGEEETPEEKEAREKKEAEDKSDDKKDDKKKEEAEAKETERLEKKAEKLGKTVDEVKELESSEKAETERIDKIAKEEGITAKEVKENEDKDKSLAERHGNDPVKIARAMRKGQSEYGKIKKGYDELVDYKAQSEAQRTKFNEKAFNDRMEKHREDVIEKYRKTFPDDSEDVSDDAIFERGKNLIKKGIEKKEEASAKEVETKAKEKRAELIKTLPEEFKDHLSEVKEILAECDDLQVLDKGFDVVYLANYTRGKKYTPDYVKSLEDAAYKRGAEQAKILPKGGKPPKPTGDKAKDKVPANMTSEQKERAEDIYGRREGWSKEQMWIEYMKNDVKNDF